MSKCNTSTSAKSDVWDRLQSNNFAVMVTLCNFELKTPLKLTLPNNKRFVTLWGLQETNYH